MTVRGAHRRPGTHLCRITGIKLAEASRTASRQGRRPDRAASVRSSKSGASAPARGGRAARRASQHVDGAELPHGVLRPALGACGLQTLGIGGHGGADLERRAAILADVIVSRHTGCSVRVSGPSVAQRPTNTRIAIYLCSANSKGVTFCALDRTLVPANVTRPPDAWPSTPDSKRPHTQRRQPVPTPAVHRSGDDTRRAGRHTPMPSLYSMSVPNSDDSSARCSMILRPVSSSASRGVPRCERGATWPRSRG